VGVAVALPQPRLTVRVHRVHIRAPAMRTPTSTSPQRPPGPKTLTLIPRRPSPKDRSGLGSDFAPCMCVVVRACAAWERPAAAAEALSRAGMSTPDVRPPLTANRVCGTRQPRDGHVTHEGFARLPGMGRGITHREGTLVGRCSRLSSASSCWSNTNSSVKSTPSKPHSVQSMRAIALVGPYSLSRAR